VPGVVERLAHRTDVAGHARGRLVVADQYRLDLVIPVGGQTLRIEIDRHALAPLDLDRLDLEPMALAEVHP
jgi:hypothetical protein